MIIFKANSFLLSGKNYSYAMRVTDTGFLQHLHYGGKILERDLPRLCKMSDTTKPNNDINMDWRFDTMPSEYGFYAHGDYREPTAIFEREDGGTVSRLRYKGYEITNGAVDIKGMPHIRTADQTLAVTLKDDFSETEVVLYYTVCDDSDVLVRNAVIKNTGKTAVMLKKAFSFRLELANGNYRCLQLGGTWSQECTPRITEFSLGVTKVHSLRGCGFHTTNQFMGALRDNCTEQSGECYGVQLIYSGSFSITGECYKHNTLCLQGGIADTGFGWEIQGGESFTTPQVALCYSNSGIGGMSRSYHDFLRERIINPDFVRKSRPIVINNWEATYFDFDNDKLCAIIDEAAKLGIDTFVLDDGWFGARNNDWAGLGDWVVNEEKLKGGLKTVIDRCKSHGMKFGLWFEPEMVNEDSDLYRAHPDWAIHKDGVEPMRVRQQLVLDFTRKEVVNYIYDAVSKVLASNEISYVKWDMNRTISECYSQSLPANRQGEFMHRYILGVYDLAERLMKKFPKVFFEGCASGGGRFDAGMLYYFPQIWTSDGTDAYERTKIQYGTSICYPVSAMSCHVSACPNHQTGRTTSFKTRGDIASLGATGYELNLTELTDEEKTQAKQQIQDYKKISELVLNGDLYRLSSPFDSNYFCEMLVSKDKRKAYIVGERIHTYPRAWDTNHYLYIHGLNENKIYEIAELGVEASGASLKYAGILLPKVNDFESFVWHIQEIK